MEEHVQTTPAPERGVGRQIVWGDGDWQAILRDVETWCELLDEQPFRGVQIISHLIELFGARTQQLNCEVHGLGPVAPDETPDDGMPFETAEQMLPHARKSKVRLPDVKHNILIPK